MSALYSSMVNFVPMQALPLQAVYTHRPRASLPRFLLAHCQQRILILALSALSIPTIGLIRRSCVIKKMMFMPLSIISTPPMQT